MKIYLISTSALPVPPPTYGGTEQVVWNLAVSLRDLGHEVTVACPTGSKLPDGVEQLETDLDNYWNENSSFLKIIQDRRLLDSDIIHDHSLQKLIYTLFKDEENTYYTSTLHCPTIPLLPVVHPNLCTLSKDHSEAIFDLYHYRSKVVYNGIDLPPLSIHRGEVQVYILGRPIEEKGIGSRTDLQGEG